jgi:hypothetical protein
VAWEPRDRGSARACEDVMSKCNISIAGYNGYFYDRLYVITENYSCENHPLARLVAWGVHKVRQQQVGGTACRLGAEAADRARNCGDSLDG